MNENRTDLLPVCQSRRERTERDPRSIADS